MSMFETLNKTFNNASKSSTKNDEEKYIGLKGNTKKNIRILVYLILILIRSSIALGPYSGQENAPFYGDFECHRMWMVVTHNLPPSQWYIDNPYMNSTYWPLDYPPLCAYTHWLMAKVISLT